MFRLLSDRSLTNRGVLYQITQLADVNTSLPIQFFMQLPCKYHLFLCFDLVDNLYLRSSAPNILCFYSSTVGEYD
jgi:hypothetical protein